MLNKMSPFFTILFSFLILKEKIRLVPALMVVTAFIGSGGKTINKIIDETGVKIDIMDDGTVFIATCDEAMSKKAKAMEKKDK